MSAFPYTCEVPRCGERVLLTRAEFDARKGVVRCPACLEAAVRVTTARKLRQFGRDREARRAPACEGCGTTSNPRKHVRLNPRNLHDETALLCLPCGKRLGYQPVSFDRISANVHGREAA